MAAKAVIGLFCLLMRFEKYMLVAWLKGVSWGWDIM